MTARYYSEVILGKKKKKKENMNLAHRYETRAALISAVNWYLNTKSTSCFAEGIQKLP